MKEVIAGYEVYDWDIEIFKKHLDQIMFMTGDKINIIKSDFDRQRFYVIPEELYKSSIELIQKAKKEKKT